MAKGSGTRSGLLWEVERLLNEVDELPQVLMMENVTAVHGTGNDRHFMEWQDFLRSKGYVSYFTDMNAADYGVAQHRERTFMVSLYGDCEYNYKFPEEIPLETIMADYLDDEVAENYYINSDRANALIQKLRDDGTLEKIDDGYKVITPETAIYLDGGAEQHR